MNKKTVIFIFHIIIFLLFLNSCTRKNIDDASNNANNNSTDYANEENYTKFEYPKIMYVTSKEGLRVRSEPSDWGKVMRTLSYREDVKVYGKQNEPVTIRDITDYWYNMEILPGYSSNEWIFGGYLSEDLPKDLPETPINLDLLDIDSIKKMFVGKWVCRNHFITFHNDGKFNWFLDASSSSASGYWDIIDKKLIITFKKRMEDFEDWVGNKVEKYRFLFTNDTLKLFYEGESDAFIFVPYDFEELIFIKADENDNWDNYQKWQNRFGHLLW